MMLIKHTSRFTTPRDLMHHTIIMLMICMNSAETFWMNFCHEIEAYRYSSSVSMFSGRVWAQRRCYVLYSCFLNFDYLSKYPRTLSVVILDIQASRYIYPHNQIRYGNSSSYLPVYLRLYLQ